MDSKGWEHRKAFIQDMQGEIYSATLNIARGNERNILYAINNVRKIDKGSTAGGAVSSARRSGRDSLTSHNASSDGRIAQNGRNVKKKFSLSPTEKAQRAQERAETAAAKAEEAKQAAQESYKRELTGGLKKLFEVQRYDFELFQRCQREGVGISVMKPFFAGRLLSADQSPFGAALTRSQYLQYAIDRPGVLVVVPGVQTMEHLDQILEFLTATDEEKDYSVIGTFTADTVTGTCVYCNHCQPCPAGIDIGLVNKYYDLALAGDTIAANHYTKLSVNADACLHCGHCESRCPFGVKQESRMETIARYFG